MQTLEVLQVPRDYRYPGWGQCIRGRFQGATHRTLKLASEIRAQAAFDGSRRILEVAQVIFGAYGWCQLMATWQEASRCLRVCSLNVSRSF